MNRKFSRSCTPSLRESLYRHSLWQRLAEDIKDGEVFPAIRNETIDFYYKGGHLFGFDAHGFSTHRKYSAICKSNDMNDRSNRPYLREGDLSQLRPIRDFVDGYDQIKEYSALYSGIEAVQVADIYSKHSPANANLKVCVLDIEAQFPNLDNPKKWDRIDLVLLDKRSNRIVFTEAKDFSNKEIWSATRPKVISQVIRYEKVLRHYREQILTAYAHYVDALNDLLGHATGEKFAIKAPMDIEKKVPLLVFGFDEDQRKGRLKKLLGTEGKLRDVQIEGASNDIYCYAKGDVSSGLKLEQLIP